MRDVRSTGARWLPLALPLTPLIRRTILVHAVPGTGPWRSTCPSCDAPLPPAGDAGNGALLPRARCAACGDRTGAPPYLVELALAAAAALVAATVAAGGWSPAAAVALAGWAVCAVPLMFVDVSVHRLPDRLTLPAGGWVLGWLGIAAAVIGDVDSWLRSAMAAAACFLGFTAIALVFPKTGYGWGDAKLAIGAAALLGWLGWSAVLAGLLLAFFGSGLTATTLLLLRRKAWRDHLPFGPFLIAGTLATLALAAFADLATAGA